QKSAKTSNNNVRAALLQVVPEEVYYILESLPTARLMWILLKTYYQPKSEAVVDSPLEEFWSF
ncbi:Bgt-50437, partial [Blumeria graminis f. sp. tritici]